VWPAMSHSISAAKSPAPLSIVLTADPEVRVPPVDYGGIERIVALLADGLAQRGHSVTLFAREGSRTAANLEPYRGMTSVGKSDCVRNCAQISRFVATHDVDLIHSFGRLAYLALLLPFRVPKVMSYQRRITETSVDIGQRFSRGSLHFTGCSRFLIKSYADRSNWHFVYNGVDAGAYHFQPAVHDDAPLVFLGRLEPIKGAHLAIQVSKRTGRKLILAGNVPKAYKSYFDRYIAGHIDGRHIEYVGPVTDSEKNALLGHAWCLLMPIQWDEPFGIVMVEALACGTPVVGIGRGAVPEIVENGVNGLVCGSIDEMVEKVPLVGLLKRADCRHVMEEHFSSRVMVNAYLHVYDSLPRTTTPGVRQAV
jgi:glycosyltransferase involved in cell wall biosynthesis